MNNKEKASQLRNKVNLNIAYDLIAEMRKLGRNYCLLGYISNSTKECLEFEGYKVVKERSLYKIEWSN